MKRKLLWPTILGLLGFSIFVTSVALAAPSQPRAASAAAAPLFQATMTPTVTVTPTTTVTPTVTPTVTVTPSPTGTHPVATALSEYFGVPYSEIADLHDQGLGFGVIAKAYFAAQKLGEDITPEILLDEFQAGTGWGKLMKKYDLHPGRSGRGGNLGDVMSGRGPRKDSPDDGSTLDATGAGSDDDGRPGNGHGPDFTPPGHDKDKDKDKGKGPRWNRS